MSGNEKTVFLFLNHWARRLGGAEHSLLDILRGMRDTCECSLVASEDGILIERARELSVTCHIIPCPASLEHIRRWNLLRTLLFSWRDLRAFFLFILNIKKVVDQYKPHLIHANVPKSHSALFILRLLGYRGVCLFHIREIFKRNSTAFLIYSLLFPKRNSCAIAISHAVKQGLPHAMQSRTTVLYNGVFCLSSPRHYFSDKILKLLYLGRIVPWKGCHVLLDILLLLKQQYPLQRITLALVGDSHYWSDDYRQTLRQKINSSALADCCQLLPYTDNPQTVYQAHDIFCNASENEPFGRAVAEAQGCGLPVVAFSTGGVPEIVVHNETGLLVPPDDIAGFAEAVSTFITHPECIKKMGLKGRERVYQHFNRETQVPRICTFINSQIPLS